ncbi:MAG: alpha/beta fold hydrolase [Kiritimatiellia bacterium]
MRRVLFLLFSLLLFGSAFAAVPEEAVYQWAADVTGVVSKETKAAPRAYLWLPPATVKAKGLVLAQHNMLEEPVFAHPAFRAELAKADVGLVWITPMVMQAWDKLADAELAAFENVLLALGEKSGHPELGTVPLAPFGHSAMATYPYLFAAARPERTFCAVSIKGDWPTKGRPCWEPAKVAARAKVPLLLVTGEYEDGYNRREKARDLMKEIPDATFSVWVDVGGGHFDWSDELCRGLGAWFAEMAGRCDELSGRRDVSSRQQGGYSSANAARRRVSQCVKSNGFWYPSERLAKRVAAYEALPRGKGKFTVLGYEYEGKTLEQNPKAHLQVVFGTKDMTFEVKPVFETTVPPGRPETWTGKKAGEANEVPGVTSRRGAGKSAVTAARREVTPGTLVLQKIQGPVEHLGGNRWAVRYNRYDPRGYRSREASFQMVYSGSDGFKRSVQQGLVHLPWPRQDLKNGGVFTVSAKDFPKTVPAGHGAYVREGPAVIENGRIVLKDVPKRLKGPIDIAVVSYDLARKEPSVLTVYRLVR